MFQEMQSNLNFQLDIIFAPKFEFEFEFHFILIRYHFKL
jgi:hypothetical protein